MRTKTQDAIDRRKLLEREKALLFMHLYKLISPELGGRNFDLEHADRDRSFRMSMGYGEDEAYVADALIRLFGGVVEVTKDLRGEGCCEECYSESDVSVFNVSLITKNWPAEELAKLAPARRKTT